MHRRLSRGVTTLPFAECEDKLTELLREFGPSRRSYHPEYPFWRLRNDGIWTVTWDGMAHGGLPSRASNNDPPRSALRAAHAIGAFPRTFSNAVALQPECLADEHLEIAPTHSVQCAGGVAALARRGQQFLALVAPPGRCSRTAQAYERHGILAQAGSSPPDASAA